MVAMIVLSTFRLSKKQDNKINPYSSNPNKGNNDCESDFERRNMDLSKSVSMKFSRDQTLTFVADTSSNCNAVAPLKTPPNLLESPPQVSDSCGFASSAEMNYFICSRGETLVEVTNGYKKFSGHLQ